MKQSFAERDKEMRGVEGEKFFISLSFFSLRISASPLRLCGEKGFCHEPVGKEELHASLVSRF